jgi:hypothetical protein
MVKRKKKTELLTDGRNNAKPLVLNWQRSTHITFLEKRGKNYVEVTANAGDKIKIRGEQGWFIFQQYVINLDNEAEWIDVIQLFGVEQERGPMRSFRPNRASKIYRVIKRRKPRKKVAA